MYWILLIFSIILTIIVYFLLNKIKIIEDSSTQESNEIFNMIGTTQLKTIISDERNLFLYHQVYTSSEFYHTYKKEIKYLQINLLIDGISFEKRINDLFLIDNLSNGEYCVEYTKIFNINKHLIDIKLYSIKVKDTKYIIKE